MRGGGLQGRPACHPTHLVPPCATPKSLHATYHPVTYPTPCLELQKTGTPPSQSISSIFRELYKGSRLATTLRVAVSITSPASPTYTNRPSRLCCSQPSARQSYAQGVSLWCIDRVNQMPATCLGAVAGTWETSNTCT